jgi:hypothetical protein
MLSCHKNCQVALPEITIYINCDTPLAINLRAFDLSEHDELIFSIKNYDYMESPYVFLFRARKGDEDINGEVIFKISAEDSKKLKPGAFYNFAVLTKATEKLAETGYRKLTTNGKIMLDYGAQDLTINPELDHVGNTEGPTSST